MTIYRAHAKVNWALGVLNKRADGYHELDTLMQKIDLFDEIAYEESSELIIESDIDLPEQNNMRRAAELYANRAGLKNRGLKLTVSHRIPTCAGLGGSSADAAAVLDIMQSVYGCLEEDELHDLALRIGADVPFCLQQCACRCRGVGEIMEPLEIGAYDLLLVKPERGVSTGALFGKLELPLKAVSVDDAAAALKGRRFDLFGKALANALQEPARVIMPEIGSICDKLKEAGAVAALMTGSGSCCFGVFEDRERAVCAKTHFGEYAFCEVVRAGYVGEEQRFEV